MEIIRYCFVKDCYVGIMRFKDDGEITMTWEDDSKLSELALTYKKYLNLDSTRMIKLFISERVIDERRPDRSLWLSMCGINNPNASDLEIFLNNHGVSINDYFWTDKVKSPAYWNKYLSKC